MRRVSATVSLASTVASAVGSMERVAVGLPAAKVMEPDVLEKEAAPDWV